MSLLRAAIEADIVGEVLAEVDRAEGLHGRQTDLADGTGRFGDPISETIARQQCVAAFAAGQGTWRHILDEEVAEAYAAPTPERLREELVQVAAMAVAWIRALDERQAESL